MPTQSELGLYPLPTYAEGPDTPAVLASLVEAMEQHDVLWAISVNDRNQRYNACVDGTIVAIATTSLSGLYMKVPTEISDTRWVTIWANDMTVNPLQNPVLFASSEAERNARYGAAQLGTLATITPGAGAGVTGLVGVYIKTGTASNAWVPVWTNVPPAANPFLPVPPTWLTAANADLVSGFYRVKDGWMEMNLAFTWKGDDISIGSSGNFADKEVARLPASLAPKGFESWAVHFAPILAQVNLTTAGVMSLASGLPGTTLASNNTVYTGTIRYPLATP